MTAEQTNQERGMKFRKKPIVIEAMRWPADISSKGGPISERAQPFHDWIGKSFGDYWHGGLLWGRIQTLEGVMEVSPGDWIIKGVKGEFYPCKPDIFDETYEAADDQESIECTCCVVGGLDEAFLKSTPLHVQHSPGPEVWEALEKLTDYLASEECWTDHHGYCQAHLLEQVYDDFH